MVVFPYGVSGSCPLRNAVLLKFLRKEGYRLCESGWCRGVYSGEVDPALAIFTGQLRVYSQSATFCRGLPKREFKHCRLNFSHSLLSSWVRYVFV